ncbi:MAG: hypothetical protein ACLQMF_19610 [Rectinemataceae bacterium]
MTDVLVRTSGIAKEFSSVRVLDDISIEIRRGEILGIMGENGAGLLDRRGMIAQTQELMKTLGASVNLALLGVRGQNLPGFIQKKLPSAISMSCE